MWGCILPWLCPRPPSTLLEMRAGGVLASGGRPTREEAPGDLAGMSLLPGVPLG